MKNKSPRLSNSSSISPKSGNNIISDSDKDMLQLKINVPTLR